MNLQSKVLIPVIAVLILSFTFISVVSVRLANNAAGSVLELMDEKHINQAQTLAYMIAEDPSLLDYDANGYNAKLDYLAGLFGVDEVHITDEKGVLWWGNIQDFYGFDFQDGDQTRPLLSILNNPGQAIAQEPQPRGVDGVMFQYVSVSRQDQKGIVQVGVSMNRIEDIKNGLNSSGYIVAISVITTVIVAFIIIWLLRWVMKKVYWYENILDCIPMPLSITDTNRNWTFINKPVENFLGVSRAKIIGQPCSNWRAGICNTPECGINCLERGKLSTNFEQSGMSFKVDTSYLTDMRGKKVGHIEVVQDITEIVRAQREEATLMSDISRISSSFISESRQIAEGSRSLADGSAQQALAVEELSASITEIADNTKTNAEMARKAAALAETIKSNAQTGNRQMDDMTAAVKEINDASHQISKVIKVIDDIAFQTNILALNAAVEAARAGQHGKGFAVVAEEVRNLASKSAGAAKETGALIQNSAEKAELGAKIADETAASLAEIVSGINESSQIVAEIARSSEEQTRGIAQINKGIGQVTHIVTQTNTIARESAQASESMSSQSEMLEELLLQFNKKEERLMLKDR